MARLITLIPICIIIPPFLLLIYKILSYIRIGHARIYLKQYPDKTIAEIARMCGFEQVGYFGKILKNYRRNSGQIQKKIKILKLLRINRDLSNIDLIFSAICSALARRSKFSSA